MGSPTSKIFNTVETTEDLQIIVWDELIRQPQMCYMNEEALPIAALAFFKMDEKCKKQVLRYARHVDRKLSMAGTARGNAFHKIPTVLSGIIYLTYYPEQIKELTLDELTILSRFSIVEQPGFYEGAVDYLGHELLTAVAEKHFDYMFQSTFLNYAESKIRQGQSKESVATYIKEIPIEQLKEETFEYERQSLQEVGKYL